MTTKTKTRKELRDMMDKHDAYVSKIGQAAAKRYLQSKEAQSTPGDWAREAAHLAVLIFALAILFVIAFAL